MPVKEPAIGWSPEHIKWLTGPIARHDGSLEPVKGDTSSLLSLLYGLIPRVGASDEQNIEGTLGALMPGAELRQMRGLARIAPGASVLDSIGYHGTPHTFPPTEGNPLGEFDSSKIGTGEGAQAYGHGLYFAENRKTAQQYADDLAKVDVEGQDMSRSYVGAAEKLKESLSWAKQFPSKAAALKELNKEFNPKSQFVKSSLIAWNNPKIDKAQMAFANKYLGKLWAIENPQAAVSIQKNLYTVDIPDEHINKMLDWDKPMGQQPPEVQNILNELPELSRARSDPVAWPHYRGESLYYQLGQGPQASAKLNASGIPGIRYLDQGSSRLRQDLAPKLTSNYVVFDPSSVKILNRE